MHVLVVFFGVKVLLLSPGWLARSGVLLDWLQLSIMASSFACSSRSRFLDKYFSDSGLSRHLVGSLFCGVWLHLSVTFLGPLGRRLVDFWRLVIVVSALAFGLILAMVFPCCFSDFFVLVSCGFLSCVASGLLGHLLPFGRLPARLVVCLLLLVASFLAACFLVSFHGPSGPR